MLKKVYSVQSYNIRPTVHYNSIQGRDVRRCTETEFRFGFGF